MSKKEIPFRDLPLAVDSRERAALLTLLAEPGAPPVATTIRQQLPTKPVEAGDAADILLSRSDMRLFLDWCATKTVDPLLRFFLVRVAYKIDPPTS